MIRAILIIIVLGALAGCGSTPVQENYYSLVLAAGDAGTPTTAEAPAIDLVIGPIALPEYLQRRGLAMQFGANQVRTANHHLWAEPLEEGIAKVLVRDIGNLIGDMSVDRDAGRWSGPADCRLRIEFDSFHATDRSTVVSSGRYWLISGDAEARQTFDVTERLTADGHAHAVYALRRSLQSLATQMSETIRSECRPAPAYSETR